MSPIFIKRSSANEVAVTAGAKLATLIPGVKLEDIGRYNWGTDDKAAINRALVELVGCKTVNDADPLQSELDPALGPNQKIYKPVEWTPATESYAFGKTVTVKLKKQLPMPAVAITKLTRWFTPGSGSGSTPCEVEYRLEGSAVRASKSCVEVHVARHIDQGKSLSSYYQIKETPRDTTQPVSANNPTERNQVSCGTNTGKDEDTHIWRSAVDTSAAPGQSITKQWDGQSQATEGVLKGNKYINSSCAPYSVLVRYYKNDADNEVRIGFAESFYPRWNVRKGGTRKVDPDSLVVKWLITGDTNKKLKMGQLIVFDKDSKPVFRRGLDENTINDGKLDLKGLWKESDIKRAEMPYRAQIQVHTGPDEADGLALAVMPTQVRAFDYDKVQFIAFHVKPPSPYAGDADHDADIKVRCDLMIDAMKKALGPSDKTDTTLKVFMAPEFYFRGPEGAYPVERIETIVPQLREESDKIEYRDWMFVFGTAIGYQKHEDPTSHTQLEYEGTTHEYALSNAKPNEVTLTPRMGATGIPEPKVGWFLLQPSKAAAIATVVTETKHQKYKVTFSGTTMFTPGDAATFLPILLLETDPPTGPSNRVRVSSRICETIPPVPLDNKPWALFQSTTATWITGCARHGATKDEFWLTLNPPKAFVPGPVKLQEPITTEVINVALVQKGYPLTRMGDGSLYHAAIYKEYVSHIDFARTNDLYWSWPSSREISIHYEDRPVLPTFGSADVGGASPNTKRKKPTKAAGSEINKTGIGGGVVYSMNDITFGLEICLDHGKDRLWNFYNDQNNSGTIVPKQAVAGDPEIQLLLIPSWGMTIGGGKIYCPAPKGPLFNVDGSRGDSVARFNNSSPRCDDHPKKTGTLGATCGERKRKYVCPTCKLESSVPGNCLVHTGTALAPHVKCAKTPRKACKATCAVGTRCSHSKTKSIYACTNCGNWHRQSKPCGCSSPNPKPFATPCGNWYPEPTASCPDCGGKVVATCDEKLQAIGAPLTATLAPIHVKTTTSPHFDDEDVNGAANVLLYDVVDVPKPDLV